jgi:hypothetical protein
MNERIRSLLELAEYQAKKQSGYEDWEVYVEPSRKHILKKFAELIVRECADIAQQHNKSPVAAPLAIGYVIREHFGVEE